MRWLSLSTMTKIGPLSALIDARTCLDRRPASSTPSGARSATPITSARPPDRSVADPDNTPLSFLTSWPPGNMDVRMLSSVTTRPPGLIGNRDELFGGQFGD